VREIPAARGGIGVALDDGTMKKTDRKLPLRTQTIHVLDANALRAVVGGSLQPIEQGFIMQDTVIVPTSRR